MVITVDVEVVIARPLADVFAFVCDLRNEPKWWTGVRRAERLRGDGGVGTVYRLESRLLGFKDVAEIEVTQSSPPVSQTIVVREGRLPYICRYALEPGTKLRISVDIGTVAPWSMLGPFLKPVITAVTRHHLRRLNRVLTD